MKDTIVEIDLKKIFRVLLKRAWIIVLCAVWLGAMTFAYTAYFVTPMYTASVTMHVNNSKGDSEVVSSGNLAVALQLVKTYVTIIRSDRVLDKAIAEGDLPYTASQIKGMMTAASIDETEVFRVTITNSNPKMAAKIADAVANAAREEIPAIIKGSTANIIDYAKVPTGKSSPNVPTNTIVGAMVGVILSAAVFVVHTVLDMRVKDESDLESICDVPVLGRIPDMTLLAPNTEKKGAR